MMIQREFSPRNINAILNHPSVYPWVNGAVSGDLDISPVLADPRHVALFGEHGGVIFIHHQGGLYEAHTQVLPEGRGKWTVDMVNEALAWMFTHTDAVEIMTRVPEGNRAAKGLAIAIHGKYEFTNPRGWIKDGKSIPAEIYALRIQDWMRFAPSLPAHGRWFHERLTAEYARLGRKDDIHPDDETHDRYVGASVAMILGGQPHKAVIFYNRWAIMADYVPIRLLDTNPIAIDIADAIVVWRHNNLEVVSCRLVQQ